MAVVSTTETTLLGELQDLRLTPTLRTMLVRYLADDDFRRRLHADTVATLSQAEIVLSPTEFELLMTWLPRVSSDPQRFISIDLGLWTGSSPR